MISVTQLISVFRQRRGAEEIKNVRKELFGSRLNRSYEAKSLSYRQVRFSQAVFISAFVELCTLISQLQMELEGTLAFLILWSSLVFAGLLEII